VTHPSPGQQVPGPVVGLNGHALGAARVDFVEDGLRLGAAQVGPDGAWAWDSGWSWVPGPHTVECYATDAMGNESGWTSVPFQVAAPEPSYAQDPGAFRL
jgi:hypothetical protein